jgi:hypothetical protein
VNTDRQAKSCGTAGKQRPWKSLRDSHFSDSCNNNKLLLDDRDHFLENPTASVALAPTTDHIDPGTLITVSPESRLPSSESPINLLSRTTKSASFRTLSSSPAMMNTGRVE